MKLVDYLRALLSRFYSKAESSQVGHQSCPSTSAITLKASGDSASGSTYSYTTTADGYIDASGQAGDPNTEIGISYGDLSERNSQPNQGWGVSANMYVPKGAKVSVVNSNRVNGLTVKFYKTIGEMGGGNLAHSLGGVLCLLGSSVHYSKRLLAVRKVGLVTSLCHQAKLLNCLLSQNKFKGIQLHAMGGLLYLRKELEQVFVTLGHRISDAHLMVVGAQLLSCSEKASSLTTNSNQIRQTLEYSSSSPSALYNLSFGGASC